MEVQFDRTPSGKIIVFMYPDGDKSRITLMPGRSGLPINIRYEN